MCERSPLLIGILSDWAFSDRREEVSQISGTPTKTSPEALARARSSQGGEGGETYLSGPAWSHHKAPHRSAALTGGTGRAAASPHTAAAGGPAYAAACKAKAGVH